MGLPVLIAVCGDPGGANAVAPVIEALRAEGRVAVRALAYRQAGSMWEKRNLMFDELVENVSGAAMLDMLRSPGVAMVLTGTSGNGVNLEKEFVAVARESGLPSLAVLDFWSNYALRFADFDGRLTYVPDCIAVMDELARDEMVAEGFDPSRLIITGQPAFDDLADWQSRFTPERRLAVRDALGVGPGTLLVVFASQLVSPLEGVNSKRSLYPGFDQQTVLVSLVNALDRIAQRNQQQIVLAIRLHPYEKAESFEGVRGCGIRFVVSTVGHSRDLAMAADLVTGISTVLLVEACYLGCVTVSLQPGLLLRDVLPTNHIGLSRPIYREEEVVPVLEQMLLDEGARLAVRKRLSELRRDSGAAQRVTKLVYQMVGLDSR